MKKLFKLLAVVIAIASIATLAVNAETTYNFTTEVFSTTNDTGSLEDLPVAGDVILNADCNEDIAGYVDSVTNLGSGEFCIKAEGQVWYTFNAPQDGTYTVAFLYVANPGKTRGTGWAFDNVDSINTVWCEDTGADMNDVKWVYFDVTLTAGDHTLYLTTPEGFDDSAYKTVGFWQVAIVYDATKNAAAEEVAEEVVATEEPAVEPEVVIAPAAQTADLAVVAIVALGAFAVAKKH